MGREIDPQTGYYNFTVHGIKTPPPEIGLIAGDVIHNLRSASDHLAYQPVLANGQVPSRHNCFPIVDDVAKYRAMDLRKVRGMSKGAIDAIDAAKLYKSGDEPLWVVHELDIADKHHALLATVVTIIRCKPIGKMVGQLVTHVNGTIITYESFAISIMGSGERAVQE